MACAWHGIFALMLSCDEAAASNVRYLEAQLLSYLGRQRGQPALRSAHRRTVSSYLYDHRGLRGRKTLSNPPAGVPAITLYTHDPNGHLFQEIAGSGNNIGQALVTYLWQDDVPAAIVLGPNTPGNPSAQDKLLYLEVDHLNTPRIARDEQKRVVWRWDSDAFGSTAPNEDPDGDGIKTTINLRFPGQYFDAESGLHYNWHRYYDPQVGRYTQPDPIGVEGGGTRTHMSMATR